MEKLNSTWRGIKKPTNVLSFSMMENSGSGSKMTGSGKPDLPPETNLMGDVVISIETAAREADQAKITLEQRLSQLLIHGILHLIGFDHEKGGDMAERMEQKSLDLLRLIEDDTDLCAF